MLKNLVYKFKYSARVQQRAQRLASLFDEGYSQKPRTTFNRTEEVISYLAGYLSKALQFEPEQFVHSYNQCLLMANLHEVSFYNNISIQVPSSWANIKAFQKDFSPVIDQGKVINDVFEAATTYRSLILRGLA